MNPFQQLAQLMPQKQAPIQQNFNPEQFKSIIPQLSDSLINKVILQARMQGISEQQIKEGLAIINKYK